MKDKMQRLLQSSLIKFLLVGVINTILGLSAMYICLAILTHGGWFNDTINYWLSSATNIVVGSIASYILNKHFTFQSDTKGKDDLVPFIINIAVCYFIAYGIAKPLGMLLFSQSNAIVKSVISLLLGSVLFTLINYFGQRFWVFKEKK